jgi:3'(2'), 5'-bisphosphate nucleotidase
MTAAASTTAAQLGREARLAIRAVDEAVRLARGFEARPPAATLTKADASPLTIADFAVQAIVAARLARDFPDDPVVAEEDASSLRGGPGGSLSDEVTALVRQAIPGAQPDQVLDWIDRGGGATGPRFWTLDPIDGTAGLLHGRQYVIALGLVVDGIVQVGVIGCPRLSLAGAAEGPPIRDHPGEGGTAAAVRGSGAWWSAAGSGQFVPLRVSATRDPSAARVFRSYERQHEDAERFDRIVARLGCAVPPALMDGQAKHVALAAGAGDLLLRFPPRHFHDAIWDYAPGSLLIEEAGGRMTDLAGRALDFTAGCRLLSNEGCVASNGLLHEAALAAIRHDAT